MATSTDSGICLLQTSRWLGNGGGEAPAFAKGVVGADNVAPVLASMFPVLAKIDARVGAASSPPPASTTWPVSVSTR